MNSGSYNNKRPTIVDVARHTGVSTAAASKVLRNAYGVSPDMRTKVRASMADLGYRPLASARGMRGRTQTVAVVVADLRNDFSCLLIDGIRMEAERQGYLLVVALAGSGKDAQGQAITDLIDRSIDGLVLITPLGTDAELDEVAKTVPLVVLGRHGADARFDSVAVDDFAAAGGVVDLLVELGHRNIAYIDSATDGTNDDRLPEDVRVRGYADAMLRHGLGEGIDIVQSHLSQEDGEAAGRQIIARAERPAAIFAGADVTTFGILVSLWNAGLLIPGKISVAGYAKGPTTPLAPVPLITVDQPGLAMGSAAGRLLLERIAGRADTVDILLQSTVGTAPAFCV